MCWVLSTPGYAVTVLLAVPPDRQSPSSSVGSHELMVSPNQRRRGGLGLFAGSEGLVMLLLA